MPNTISIKTNRKEIAIERDGEHVGSIWFDPADLSILARMDEAQERIKALDFSVPDNATIDVLAEASRKADAEIRAIIDFIFDYACSDVVFGRSFSFSTHSGVSQLEQFLEGASAIIKAGLETEEKAAEKRQAKYTAKYKK